MLVLISLVLGHRSVEGRRVGLVCHWEAVEFPLFVRLLGKFSILPGVLRCFRRSVDCRNEGRNR